MTSSGGSPSRGEPPSPGERPTPGAAVRYRPGWLVPTSLVLAVVGLLLSAYLTYEHFTGSTTLACAESATVNCAKVTTSDWSRFLGLPVSVLGLAFFVAMVALCLPVVWRTAPRQTDLVRIAASAVGLVMVFYLVWAEFFKVHAICLWCTGVHITTFLLLIVLLAGEILSTDDVH